MAHDDDWLRAELEQLSAEELNVLYRMMGRDAQRSARAMLRPLGGQAVHHLDGNPLNTDLANLRVVDVRDNRRSKR